MGEVIFNLEREKNIYSTDFVTKQRHFFSFLFLNELCHSEIDLDLVQ